jgi:UDP-glucose 4-epimerase
MILIIGHGFLGSAIFSDLTRKGYAVKIFSRSLPPELLSNHFIGKIEEIEENEHIFNGISTVIHAVHTTIPYTSDSDPVGDVESNVIPFIKLLNTCKKKNISKFIYLSSGGAVYGHPTNSKPLNEIAQTNPESPYGISKLINEKYLMLYGKAFSNGFVILRASNIYGIGQNVTVPQGIIGHLIKSVKTNNEINIWGDGESRKDYLYLEDFLQAIVKVIEDKVARNCIYNIASGKTSSINELIHTVEKIANKKISCNYSPFKNFDISNIALDNSLFRETYSWKPTTLLEEGIKHIYNNTR